MQFEGSICLQLLPSNFTSSSNRVLVSTARDILEYPTITRSMPQCISARHLRQKIDFVRIFPYFRWGGQCKQTQRIQPEHIGSYVIGMKNDEGSGIYLRFRWLEAPCFKQSVTAAAKGSNAQVPRTSCPAPPRRPSTSRLFAVVRVLSLCSFIERLLGRARVQVVIYLSELKDN